MQEIHSLSPSYSVTVQADLSPLSSAHYWFQMVVWEEGQMKRPSHKKEGELHSLLAKNSTDCVERPSSPDTCLLSCRAG